MKVYIFVVKFQYIVKYTLHRKYYSLRKTVSTKFRLKKYGDANCFICSLSSHHELMCVTESGVARGASLEQGECNVLSVTAQLNGVLLSYLWPELQPWWKPNQYVFLHNPQKLFPLSSL